MNKQTSHINRKNTNRYINGPTSNLYRALNSLSITGKKHRSVKQKANHRVKKIYRNAGGESSSTGVVDYSGLSSHAKKYLTALTDPFNAFAKGAFLPRFPARMTQKASAQTSITLTIGTAGVAYALFMPTAANDLPVIIYSTDTFAGSNSTCVVPNGGTATCAAFSNLPFSSADLAVNADSSTSAVDSRVVAFGYSAEYIGTNLNKSGHFRAFEDPAHDNASRTISEISGRPETIFQSINKDGTFAFNLHPCRTGEFNFTADTNSSSAVVDASILTLYPWSARLTINADFDGSTFTWLPACLQASGNYLPAPTAVLYVEGVAGQKIILNLVTHVEYSGQKCAPQVTPSYCDEVGFSAIQGVMPQLHTAVANLSKQNRKTPQTVDIAKSLLSYGKKIAAGAVTDMVLSSLL